MATPAYSAAALLSAGMTKVMFTPPVSIGFGIAGSVMPRDIQYGGRHRIVGTVKQVGTPNQPVERRVRLFRMRDGIFIRETWSDAAGNYRFEWIDGAETYFVVSYDHAGLYRAVIADGLVPEAIS